MRIKCVAHFDKEIDYTMCDAGIRNLFDASKSERVFLFLMHASNVKIQ
jgi:hypothetical protein